MYILWSGIKNDLCRITLCLSHRQAHTHRYVHKPLSLSLSLSHTHTHTHSHTSILIFCFLNLKPAEKKMDSGNHSSLTEFILTGLTEQPQFQLPFFPSLPKNLCGHCGGEPGHDHTDWGQFSPAHPHVLFPQQFVLYWSLSGNCHYPQNAGELCDREKYHLLSWMYDSALFLSSFYYCRELCVSWNGIWPLCCHL